MKKLLRICRQRNGASLMMVLCVLVFLMILTTAVLVAASASSGEAVRRQELNQLNILTGDIQTCLMYTLQATDAQDKGKNIEASDLSTLGAQILRDAYNNENGAQERTLTYNLTADLSTGQDLSQVQEITVRVTPNVQITPEVPAEQAVVDASNNVIVEGHERIPQTAEITADITMTVRVHNGADLANEERVSLTESRYHLNGAILRDGGTADDMLIDSGGEWRLIAYEKNDI